MTSPIAPEDAPPEQSKDVRDPRLGGTTAEQPAAFMVEDSIRGTWHTAESTSHL